MPRDCLSKFRVCEGELIRFIAVSCVPTNCTAITGKSKIIMPWRIDVEHYSLNNFQMLSEKASCSPDSHLFSSSIIRSIFFSLSSFSAYSVRLKVKTVNDFVHVARSGFYVANGVTACRRYSTFWGLVLCHWRARSCSRARARASVRSSLCLLSFCLYDRFVLL